jgi:MFS family permease
MRMDVSRSLTDRLAGIVYYLSMWYKRNERQYRVALFFSAASLAGAFGGILAFAIAKMNHIGGYQGWRWMYVNWNHSV